MLLPTLRYTALPLLAAWLLTPTLLTAQPMQHPASARTNANSPIAAPESAGTLIYRGNTFGQKSAATVPLYRYERRVQITPTGLAATHFTSDPSGRAIISESAALSARYDVQRLDVVNRQVGFSGSVTISQNGRRLDYELNDNGNLSNASEEVAVPVVTGPSLFGFILANWDPLTSGATMPVRMIVLKEKTTYGFDLRFDKLADGQVVFTATPSHFLIRLALAPLKVVFDANTRNPVRYEGRVPPQENLGDKLKDLDARVEYTSIAAAYR